MRRREFVSSAAGSAFMLGVADVLGGRSAFAEAAPTEYRIAGTFVEGCTCNVVCPCAMSGSFAEACLGALVLMLTSGSYKGTDLAGTKIVWAGHAGKWSHLYVDAPTARREAATDFARALLGPMGTIESVKSASVDLSGTDGKYRLTVDGGKVLDMATEPVLGADSKTAISHTNAFVPWSPTLMQGRTVKASFHDGSRSFSLEGSNSFFNEHVSSSGKLSA